MKNAIEYRRISEKDQSNWSLGGQKLDNQNFAHRNNIQIIKSFEDNGFSAKNFDRPGWKYLMKYLKKNGKDIHFIIVTKYDRMIRNAAQGLSLIQEIEHKYDLRILSVQENINIDPASPFFFKMRADILINADFERRVIIDRSKFGIWNAKNNGRHIGVAPFGYSNERDASNLPIITKDESKFPVFDYLDKVFFNSNTTLSVIKKEARKRGFTRKGHDALMRVLLNPIIYGKILVPAYKNNVEKIINGVHKGWYPEEYFEIAKEKLIGKPQPKVVLNPELPLRGFLKCQCCGNSFTGAKSKGRNKYYYYYRCDKDKEYYRTNIVHEELESVLNQLSWDIDFAKDYKIAFQIGFEKRMKERKEKTKRFEKEVQILQSKLDKVEDDYFAGKVQDTTFKKWGNIYRRDLGGKKFELSLLKTNEDKILNLIEQELDKICDLVTIYKEATIPNKQSLLSLIFRGHFEKLNFGFGTAEINPLFEHNSQTIKGLYINRKRDTNHKNGQYPVCTRGGT